MSFALRPGAWIAVVSAALVLAAVFASSGFFTIDEAIYALGVEAARGSGGFVVANGYERFGSDNLTVWLLIAGPHGLVSQYPAGTGWFGALLQPLFGGKALMVLNLAAGIGTLIVTRALARVLFGSEVVSTLAVAVLALGTFWAEYVIGIWPHSVSVFATMLALLMFARALGREAAAVIPALWSGLAIGAGLLFRLDGVLLLPAIAVSTILWAARPIQVLAGGALGLAPMLAVLSLTNHAKFGTWSPLSYGRTGGAVAVSGYVTEAVVLALGLGVLVLLRRIPAPGPRLGRLILPAAIALIALALLSPLAPEIWRLLRGARAVLVDATSIVDPRPGVLPQPDGTILFWGLPKKALAQSLPWLGGLAFLIGARWGDRRRGLSVLLVVAGTWALPFVMRGWHGGLGSNMRYLLPILPVLAILAAWVVDRLARRVPRGPAVLLVAALAGAGLTGLGLVLAPAPAEIHQIGSVYLFYLIAALSLAAGFVDRPGLARATLGVMGLGLGMSAALAAADIAASQSVRAKNADRSAATAEIPSPVIFFGPPEWYGNAVGDPERLMALWDFDANTGTIDPEFAAAACRAGYRIVMSEGVARTAGIAPDRLKPAGVDDLGGTFPQVEVICAP